MTNRQAQVRNPNCEPEYVQIHPSSTSDSPFIHFRFTLHPLQIHFSEDTERFGTVRRDFCSNSYVSDLVSDRKLSCASECKLREAESICTTFPISAELSRQEHVSTGQGLQANGQLAVRIVSCRAVDTVNVEPGACSRSTTGTSTTTTRACPF